MFSRKVILIAILAVATVLRLWQIGDYQRFSGDEGRDALVLLHFVRDHQIPVVGPTTSIGNVALGPLYYYLLAGPMALTGNDPVAAAVAVALFGVGAVWLIYLVTRELFDPASGLIAAGLYAVAYSPVVMSKSAWNPYPVPFFVLALVFALIKSVRDRKAVWLIVAGAAYSCVVQLHGLGLALLPLLIVYWVIGFRRFQADRQVKKYLIYTLIGCLAFLAVLLPYVAHEARNNWPDVRALLDVFTQNSAVSFNFIEAVKRLFGAYGDYVQRVLTFGFRPFAIFLGALLPIAWVAWVTRRSFKQDRFSLIMIGLWSACGLGGLAFLSVIRRDYYYTIVLPVGFILFAALIRLSLRWKFWRLVGTAVFVGAFGISAWVNPFNRPAWELGQLDRTERITQAIIDQASSSDFAFRLIAPENYDAAYRFFFDRGGRFPIVEETDSLTKPRSVFYVCERQGCDHIDSTIDGQLPGYTTEVIEEYPNAQLIRAINRK